MLNKNKEFNVNISKKIKTNLEIQKENLRKEYILKRMDIPNKHEKSKQIMKKITRNILYKESKIIALYSSLDSEVDTDELIKYSIKIGKIVVLPRVEDGNLKFYKINSIDNILIKSNFGVKEPLAKEENFVSIDNIDLVIVPGICFDKNMNRLGFGKGYYDRFLANSNIETIEEVNEID